MYQAYAFVSNNFTNTSEYKLIFEDKDYSNLVKYLDINWKGYSWKILCKGKLIKGHFE